MIASNWAAWKDRTGKLGRGYPLHRVLLMWPDQQCEDSRDRVFGVIGMVDWGTSTPMSADYTKSTFALHEKVLEHVRPSYANASRNAKYGFALSMAKMLRIEDSLEAKAVIRQFVEGEWPAQIYS